MAGAATLLVGAILGTVRIDFPFRRLLPGQHGQLVLRRFFRIFSVDALVKVSGVLLLPLYLALMTQEEYATYSYLINVIGVLSLVCNFGLYVPQSKLMHDVEEPRRGALLFTINSLLLLLIAASLLPIYALGLDRSIVRLLFSSSIDYAAYRHFIFLGIILAIYAQMVLNYLLTSERIADVQAYNLSRMVFGSILTLGALYWIAGDKAGIRLAAYLLAEAALLAAFVISYVRAMHRSFDRGLAVRALRLGLPVMVSAVLGIIINFGDKFFIEKYCSLADLSIYFLAFTLAGIITAVFMSFQNVWLPLFLKEKDLARNLARTKKLFLHLVFLFVALAVLIWLGTFGALQVGILDDKYSAVLGVLPILLAGSIASSLVGLLSSYTVFWGMTYVTIVIGVLMAMASVPLNYYAVTSYGIHGIAVAVVLVNVGYGVLYFGFIRYRVAALAAGAR